MGKTFRSFGTMYGGGAINILEPGMVSMVASNTLAAYTQDECVFKLAKDANGTTQTIRARVWSDFGGNDEVSAETDIYFNISNTQYFDVRDVFRAAMQRVASSSPLHDTATAGRVEFEEYDGNNNSLGNSVYTIYIYDAVQIPDVKYHAPMPDTFRLIADASLYKMEIESIRLVNGTYTVEIRDTQDVITDTISASSGDYPTYGFGITYNPSSLTDKITIMGNTAIDSYVKWIDCDDDKAMVRWWSPVTGGWKSVCVDLLDGGMEMGDTAEYMIAFNRTDAHTGNDILRCRIPMCTANDVLYYSDLYISDLVEIEYTGKQKYFLQARVEGNPPMYKPVGHADMEFTLILQEVSTLC